MTTKTQLVSIIKINMSNQVEKYRINFIINPGTWKYFREQVYNQLLTYKEVPKKDMRIFMLKKDISNFRILFHDINELVEVDIESNYSPKKEVYMVPYTFKSVYLEKPTFPAKEYSDPCIDDNVQQPYKNVVMDLSNHINNGSSNNLCKFYCQLFGFDSISDFINYYGKEQVDTVDTWNNLFPNYPIRNGLPFCEFSQIEKLWDLYSFHFLAILSSSKVILHLGKKTHTIGDIESSTIIEIENYENLYKLKGTFDPNDLVEQYECTIKDFEAIVGITSLSFKNKLLTLVPMFKAPKQVNNPINFSRRLDLYPQNNISNYPEQFMKEIREGWPYIDFYCTYAIKTNIINDFKIIRFPIEGTFIKIDQESNFGQDLNVRLRIQSARDHSYFDGLRGDAFFLRSEDYQRMKNKAESDKARIAKFHKSDVIQNIEQIYQIYLKIRAHYSAKDIQIDRLLPFDSKADISNKYAHAYEIKNFIEKCGHEILFAFPFEKININTHNKNLDFIDSSGEISIPKIKQSSSKGSLVDWKTLVAKYPEVQVLESDNEMFIQNFDNYTKILPCCGSPTYRISRSIADVMSKTSSLNMFLTIEKIRFNLIVYILFDNESNDNYFNTIIHKIDQVHHTSFHNNSELNGMFCSIEYLPYNKKNLICVFRPSSIQKCMNALFAAMLFTKNTYCFLSDPIHKLEIISQYSNYCSNLGRIVDSFKMKNDFEFGSFENVSYHFLDQCTLENYEKELDRRSKKDLVNLKTMYYVLCEYESIYSPEFIVATYTSLISINKDSEEESDDEEESEPENQE